MRAKASGPSEACDTAFKKLAEVAGALSLFRRRHMDYLQFVPVVIAIALLMAFVIGWNRRRAIPTEIPTNEPEITKPPAEPERTEPMAPSATRDLTLSAKREERLRRLLKYGRHDEMLCQLPPLPPFFTGRRSELALTFALLDAPDPSHVIGVFAGRGLAGAGCSGFATILGHLLAERYPDAQLFLDLTGDDAATHARSVSDAMCHVVQSLNPGVPLPRDPGDIPAAYRHALEGRRVLVLIENISPQPFIELLIPPAGSLLMLAARDPLHVPGIGVIALDPLSRPDARAFLRASGSRLAREPDKHLDLLAELSGYLPTALRINAGRMHANPGQSIDAQIDMLKKADAFQRPVEAAARTGFSALQSDVQRGLQLLAAISDDFDAADAVAVCEVDQNEMLGHLNALLTAGLICILEAGESVRFRLYECARQLGDRSGEEADRANLRMARHRATLPAGGRRESIVAGWKWTRGYVQRFQFHSDDDFSPAQTPEPFAAPTRVPVNAYFEALRLLVDFPNAGSHVRTTTWLEAAVSAARALGDRGAESRTLCALGKAGLHAGEARLAVACFEEWVEIARGAGNRPGEAEALGWLGSGWMEAGFADRGTGCFEAQLGIAREMGDRTVEVRALGKLGHAKSSAGEFQSAAGIHDEELRIAREIADRAGEADALESLGIVWTRLEDFQKSETFHQEQLRVAQETGDRAGETRALGHIGHTALHRGQVEAAIMCYDAQLRLARECRDRETEAHAHASLGVAWARQGDVRKAVEHYGEQWQIACQVGDRLGEATAYSKIGTGLETVGDPVGAVAAWEKALAIYESLGSASAEPLRRWLERARKTLAEAGARP